MILAQGLNRRDFADHSTNPKPAPFRGDGRTLCDRSALDLGSVRAFSREMVDWSTA